MRRKEPVVLFAVAVLFGAAILGLLAPWLAPYSPSQTFEGAYSLPPFFMDGHDTRFWLGTDDVGRDLLTRLMYGARVSLLAGLSVAFLSVLVGTVLGALAGWRGGWIETVIMRAMDTMMALPAILLAIVIVAILGPSLVNAV
ncbi:MAG: ABC transporter permease, partial [Bdellovibrionales bacterium]|nr:ABC transporter permease [Bdellovibrionales bacterium]